MSIAHDIEEVRSKREADRNQTDHNAHVTHDAGRLPVVRGAALLAHACRQAGRREPQLVRDLAPPSLRLLRFASCVGVGRVLVLRAAAAVVLRGG